MPSTWWSEARGWRRGVPMWLDTLLSKDLVYNLWYMIIYVHIWMLLVSTIHYSLGIYIIWFVKYWYFLTDVGKHWIHWIDILEVWCLLNILNKLFCGWNNAITHPWLGMVTCHPKKWWWLGHGANAIVYRHYKSTTQSFAIDGNIYETVKTQTYVFLMGI